MLYKFLIWLITEMPGEFVQMLANPNERQIDAFVRILHNLAVACVIGGTSVLYYATGSASLWMLLLCLAVALVFVGLNLLKDKSNDEGDQQ